MTKRVRVCEERTASGSDYRVREQPLTERNADDPASRAPVDQVLRGYYVLLAYHCGAPLRPRRSLRLSPNGQARKTAEDAETRRSAQR